MILWLRITNQFKYTYLRIHKSLRIDETAGKKNGKHTLPGMDVSFFYSLKVSHKFFFYLLLVSFISFEGIAQQRFKAGVKAGLSTSQVAGDTYSGYNKVGFDGGIFVTGKLNEKWRGQFEIIYIQKGSKHNANAEIGDYNFYYLGLNYIEVPVLFQYHQKKYTFEFGPGFGYLIKEKEYLNEQDLTGARPFFKKEINFNLGISYTIITNLEINWRFTNSISAIRKHASGASRWYNPGQTNDVLAFTLTYQFGSGKTE